MTQTEIAIHLHRKKKIAHYPKLPKQLFKKGKKKDTGLITSCLQGFHKRITNWMKDDMNAELAFVHTPKPKEEVEEVVDVIAEEEE